MPDPHVSGPKLFSLDEANDLIPFLEDRLERFLSLLEQLETARNDLTVLRLVSSSGGDEENPDRKALQDAEAHAEGIARELNAIQQEILRSGCVPKSYRDGLVDFFAQREDRLVFLCWRRGEKRIGFWHTLESGFAGRRPIRTFHPGPKEPPAPSP